MNTDTLSGMYHRSKWSLVLRGVLGIAIGLFILFRPLDSVAALALVIALWALVDGIVNIVHAFDLRSIAPHWGMLLLSGIVSTLFGIAALYYYPGLSLSFAVVWTALWFIVIGAISTYIAVQERRADLPWGWTLTFGLLTIVAGVLAFAYPSITLAGLVGVIAIFAILGGVVRLTAAWKLHSFEDQIERVVHKPARA
ncbi:MAG TPA: HdeD family acid-resistance protein [Gemmatimonadaceae bacterium]|jgi:uncharacterized membrane protein HdeD (DUF308 family)|nr:HdeD family acid-resistance protein [Gemmatimonadaceae bacterium]